MTVSPDPFDLFVAEDWQGLIRLDDGRTLEEGDRALVAIGYIQRALQAVDEVNGCVDPKRWALRTQGDPSWTDRTLDKAQRDIDRALTITPDLAEAFFAKAMLMTVRIGCLLEHDAFEKADLLARDADDLFSSATAQAPNEPDCWAKWGHHLSSWMSYAPQQCKKDLLARADEVYAHALKLAPDQHKLMFDRADIFADYARSIEDEDPSSAILLYQDALDRFADIAGRYEGRPDWPGKIQSHLDALRSRKAE
jgi:tetratricopeptide (TPR) repeat protein